MSVSEHPLRKYTRRHITRTTTCPGCGIGTVSQAILRAIDELGLDMDDFVFVSGIGCSAWIPSPFYAADTLHTTHGRPIAFATGVKLGLPDKNVMVVSGDGDLTAIGGNHLIHAARRNVDLTVVLVNNGIYGMTGGQTAPTTPRGLTTITSPYGTMEHHFDIAPMVAAAGASFVARWTTYHPRQMTRSIKKGIQKKGFALIEAVSQCPVQYGKASKLGSAVRILEYFKENSVRIDKARAMEAEALAGKIIVGEWVDIAKAELTQEWTELRRKLREESECHKLI
ncbi:MAG: 2-oxoacid:ferredoxin oxidoreductase subunit beta [Desulfobacterales bacterium]|nr:MAG: 2-oxoacid:ferredoxin oxidoreductase subunit beta [Desulfobacterales bacterium]